MPAIKEELYMQCAAYLRDKEKEIKAAIAEAQDAANNETKSSAGDKFETGREAMQQEIDLNQGRLNELNKQKITLEGIIPVQRCLAASPGALVRTNNGSYYIAISAKQLKTTSGSYYAVSASSPIGAAMAGKKAGETFEMNGKQFLIESIV